MQLAMSGRLSSSITQTCVFQKPQELAPCAVWSPSLAVICIIALYCSQHQSLGDAPTHLPCSRSTNTQKISCVCGLLQTYGNLTTAAGLAEVAGYATGIGPDKQAYILNVTKGRHCVTLAGL